MAALLCLPKVANVTASLSFQARCTLAQLLAAKMMPEMPEMSSAAAEARGPPESAAAPQPAESAAGLQQEVAVAGVQAEYQVEYFATLEVAVRRQHVVSRPRRSSMSMSPATRPRQSVSSRPRDSVTPPPRPAAAATTAMTEALPPPPPPPPPLVSPRARGSPSAPRRVWPASPLMPAKTPDEGRALRANLEQVLSDHNPNPTLTLTLTLGLTLALALALALSLALALALALA